MCFQGKTLSVIFINVIFVTLAQHSHEGMQHKSFNLMVYPRQRMTSFVLKMFRLFHTLLQTLPEIACEID